MRISFVGLRYVYVPYIRRNKKYVFAWPHIKAKTKLPKLMRQIDPNFSYEFFIGKVINLIKLMIFSDDYTNLAAYDGKPMQNKFKDIIDVKYDSTLNLTDLK